jgi:glutaconate CoA-transferase subunit B
LPDGGPSKVVTSLGVFGFAECEEMQLESLHPGGTIAEVRANTGWDLRIAANVAETPTPTPEELALIRQFDTLG